MKAAITKWPAIIVPKSRMANTVHLISSPIHSRTYRGMPISSIFGIVPAQRIEVGQESLEAGFTDANEQDGNEAAQRQHHIQRKISRSPFHAQV